MSTDGSEIFRILTLACRAEPPFRRHYQSPIRIIRSSGAQRAGAYARHPCSRCRYAYYRRSTLPRGCGSSAGPRHPLTPILAAEASCGVHPVDAPADGGCAF
jgi:hypothetical protein